jgi:hypothetical protein
LIKILGFPAVTHPDMCAVGAHASRVIVHSRLAPPKNGGYKFILLVPPLRQVLIRRIWQDCLQVEEGDLDLSWPGATEALRDGALDSLPGHQHSVLGRHVLAFI